MQKDAPVAMITICAAIAVYGFDIPPATNTTACEPHGVENQCQTKVNLNSGPTLLQTRSHVSASNNAWCHAPQGIENAKRPSCKQGAIRQKNQVCTPNCEKGYSADIEKLTCQEDGSFEPSSFTCIADDPKFVTLPGCQAHWCTESDKEQQCLYVNQCKSCDFCNDVRLETPTCKKSCWESFTFEKLDLAVCSWNSCKGCEECTKPCDKVCDVPNLRKSAWESCTWLCKDCAPCVEPPTEDRLSIFCPETSVNMFDTAAPDDGILLGSTHWWPVEGQKRPYDSETYDPNTFKDEMGYNLQIYRRFSNGLSYLTDYEKLYVQKGGIIWMTWQLFDWQAVVNGEMDEELFLLAESVKSAYPAKVIVSPGYEPDHYVCDGQTAKCRGQATLYSKAFDHAYTIFESRGATNALWAIDYSHRAAYQSDRKDTPNGDGILLDLLPKKAPISWVFWNMFMPADRENMNEGRSPWAMDAIPWWCKKMAELGEKNAQLKTANFGIGAWAGGGTMTKLAANGGGEAPIPLEAYQDYVLEVRAAVRAVDENGICPQFKAVVHFNSLDGIITTSDYFPHDIVAKHDFAHGNKLTVFKKNEEMFPTLQKYFKTWAFLKNDQLVSNIDKQCKKYEDVPQPVEETPSPTPVPPPTLAPTWPNDISYLVPATNTRCSSKDWAGGGWGNLGRKITEQECLMECAKKATCKFVSYKTVGDLQCTSFKSCTPSNTKDHKTYTKSFTPQATPSPTPRQTSSPTKPPSSTGSCKKHCNSNKKGWTIKCKWSNCNGCNACASSGAGPCRKSCKQSKKSWSKKCSFKKCVGCSECA